MTIRSEIRDAITKPGHVRFPADFIGFQGHFPGQPILPAVVQALTAQMMIEDELGCRTGLVALKNAKFMEPVLPDQELVFSWSAKSELKYQVRVTVDERVVTSLVIALESRA